jgi:hypothetical protein
MMLGFANNARPFDHVVKKKVAKDEYHLQCMPRETPGSANHSFLQRNQKHSGSFARQPQSLQL